MVPNQPEKRVRVESDNVHLTLYVAEPHVGNRKSKVDQVLREAVKIGAAGGTVLAAYQGFGRRVAHEPTLWHRADETPLMVIFVDTEERITKLLAIIEAVLPDTIAFRQNVHSVQYRREHRHPTG